MQTSFDAHNVKKVALPTAANSIFLASLFHWGVQELVFWQIC